MLTYHSRRLISNPTGLTMCSWLAEFYWKRILQEWSHMHTAYIIIVGMTRLICLFSTKCEFRSSLFSSPVHSVNKKTSTLTATKRQTHYTIERNINKLEVHSTTTTKSWWIMSIIHLKINRVHTDTKSVHN